MKSDIEELSKNWNKEATEIKRCFPKINSETKIFFTNPYKNFAGENSIELKELPNLPGEKIAYDEIKNELYIKLKVGNVVKSEIDKYGHLKCTYE